MTERSESIAELAAALVKAQGQFSAIPKASENPFYKSKYADLADVVQAAAPVLNANGLAVAQFITEVDGQSALTTYLLHESGQFIADTMVLLIGKSDSQGQGSAVTYARRYSYMAALGLVADEDDDGNSASQSRRQQAPRQDYGEDDDNSYNSAPSRPVQKPGLATDKQQKAVYAIAKKRGLEVPDTKSMTFEEASKFIQDHGDAA